MDFRNQILVGDVIQRLKELPEESVHCVVTSPPYWGLRDYGVEGQIGLEPTPEEFVRKMVEVFREVRRVLRADGTLWLNIGDSYAGSGRGGNPTRESSTLEGGHESQEASMVKRRNHGLHTSAVDAGVIGTHWVPPPPGLKQKDLVGMPWRLALALQGDGWWLRSDIIWSKPNPMPESVTDRPTKAHEYLFLLSKSERYYYDGEAIREQFSESTNRQPWKREFSDERPDVGYPISSDGRTPSRKIAKKKEDFIGAHGTSGHDGAGMRMNEKWNNPAGRNKRSVWTIATEAYPEAHFATFPQKLVEPCILAGTSERGCCSKCGAPYKRDVEVEYENPGNRTTNGTRSKERKHLAYGTAGYDVRLERNVKTKGWIRTCPCWWFKTEPAIVMDPFMGSGTTALVALRAHRDFVGIELNPVYAELARKRIDPELSQMKLC